MSARVPSHWFVRCFQPSRVPLSMDPIDTSRHVGLEIHLFDPARAGLESMSVALEREWLNCGPRVPI